MHVLPMLKEDRIEVVSNCYSNRFKATALPNTCLQQHEEQKQQQQEFMSTMSSTNSIIISVFITIIRYSIFNNHPSIQFIIPSQDQILTT
jgi:hypothetical protein